MVQVDCSHGPWVPPTVLIGVDGRKIALKRLYTKLKLDIEMSFNSRIIVLFLTLSNDKWLSHERPHAPTLFASILG